MHETSEPLVRRRSSLLTVRNVLWAQPSRDGPIKGTTREKSGQGVDYELFAQRWLRERFGQCFDDETWIRYEAENCRGWLKPDGLLFLPNKVILIEIKLRTNRYLYWKLRWVYGPVVRAAFDVRSLCELGIVNACKLPIRDVPEQPHLTQEIEAISSSGYWLFHLRWF